MDSKRNRTGSDRIKIQVWEHFAALLFGCAAMFGILVLTGSIDSGYHFLDDHVMVRMEYLFQVHDASLGSTILSAVKGDLQLRFRPLYQVECVIGAYLFGSNMLYWNIYTAVKGVLTCYLLYFTARHTGNGRIISALFVAVIILGAQYTPWYRSVNQENTGLLLCALTLWLIAYQHDRRRERSALLNVLIVASAVVCGLIKESFTLFMPVFVMAKIWLQYCGTGREEPPADKRKLLGCLRENAIPCGAILAAMLVNLYWIVFEVGTDKLSYAGFHEEIPLSRYIDGIRVSLFSYLDWYTYMGAVVIVLAVMGYRLIDRRFLRQYLGFLAIGCYIMAVQLVAHATSLMWERYIIPYIIGWALVFVLMGYRIFEKDRVQRCMYIVLICFLLLQEAPKAYLGAKNYAYDGQLIQDFLQCALENTAPEDQIIGGFSAEELNLAVASWLEVRGHTKLYSYDGSSESLSDPVQLAEVNNEPGAWEQAKAAVCYSWSVGMLAEKMGLASEEEYQVYTFGDYSILVRQP